MLKSTKIKIELAEAAIRAENQQSEILNKQLQEQNKIEREKLKFESETRNRANISLKEYDEMKETIAKLESELTSATDCIRRLTKPFIDAMHKSPDSMLKTNDVGYLCDCLSSGKFKNMNVQYIESPWDDPLSIKIACVFTVDKKL